MDLSYQEQTNAGLVGSSKTHIFSDVGITGTILSPRTALVLCTEENPDPLGLIPLGDIRATSGLYHGYTVNGVQKSPGLGSTGDRVGGYPLLSNPRVDSASPGVSAILQCSQLPGVRELCTQGPGYYDGFGWRSSGLNYQLHNLCLIRHDHNPAIRYVKVTLYPVGHFEPTDDDERFGPEIVQMHFVANRGNQPNTQCPWDLGPEGRVWWWVNLDSMTESINPGPGNPPVVPVAPQFSQPMETISGIGSI